MEFTKEDPPARSALKSEICIPRSIDSAVVFGHADGDGHLAAVQTAEWLTRRDVTVKTIVSSATRNYLFWGRLAEFDLTVYSLVVFVDIAFRFSNPNESLGRLLEVSDRESEKLFMAIDHHPFVRPQVPRANLQFVEVNDPYDCCLGEPDAELMQVAALCDGSPTTVEPTPQLLKRAIGVKRAAADIRGVAGDTLLQFVVERNWQFFESLADEDRTMHLSARGIRRRSSEASPLLETARRRRPFGPTK